MILKVLLGIIAIQHFGFLILEMFLWQKPLGRKVFSMTAGQAQATAVLAGNQGLYNGFLSAGLIWAAIYPHWQVGLQLAIFFLSCVFVAGIYGAYSVSRRIIFVQAMPALIALIWCFLL